jgi:predicted DsbA family dithiol-disulfide isomerase
MTKRIRIDFVSDVSCPWCVIGLKSLEEALRRVGGGLAQICTFNPLSSIRRSQRPTRISLST